MLRLAFDFIITWRETRTRPNAYFNLEIEKAYAIGLTAIHIHSFPYLLEEFIDSLYY